MKKKLLVLCLVVMFILPATVFAGGLLGLKVGAAAILNYPIDLETFEPAMVDEFTVDDFTLGADIRANVSFVQLAAVIQSHPVPPIMDMDTELMVLEGHIGLGATLDFMGLVNLGITAGPMFGALVGQDVFMPAVNMGGGAYAPLDDDLEVLKYAPVIIRVTADVNLGGISAGLFAMVNSGVTVGELMDGVIPDDISTTAIVGASVLVSVL